MIGSGALTARGPIGRLRDRAMAVMFRRPCISGSQCSAPCGSTAWETPDDLSCFDGLAENQVDIGKAGPASAFLLCTSESFRSRRARR